MKTPPKAVLFDFDGTLAPNLDLPGMRRQVVALTAAQGVPETVYRDLYIVEIIDAAAAWLQARGTAADDYARAAHTLIEDIELEAAARTEPFDGARAALDGLRRQRCKVGVVTRNCRAAVLQTFPDLLDYADVVRARDDTEHLKPDPRHLSTTLQLLACPANRSVMVGDARLDMQVGKALGMYCVGVLSGSSDRPALEDAGADLVIEQLSATTPWAHWD